MFTLSWQVPFIHFSQWLNRHFIIIIIIIPLYFISAFDIKQIKNERTLFILDLYATIKVRPSQAHAIEKQKKES